jgi:MFS family permease
MSAQTSSGSNDALPTSLPSPVGFWALIAVQFQGAFSDNALKWLVSFLVLDATLSKERRDLWFVLVVPPLFAVPLLIFSIPGGYFADKSSKRSVTLWTKVFEFGVMGLATYALSNNRLDIAGVALFLACTQGAIFGPTKYGLLPELLPLSELSWGNGIIELGTLLAAISAALAGGFLAQTFHGRQVWSGVIFLALTALGFLTSLAISKVPAADPARRFDWNVPAEFFHEIRRMRADATLWTAVTANTFFWFLGSLLLLNIVLYATDILRVDDAHSSYLLAALSLGIGIGSFLAGLASGKKIEPGMVLPGLGGILLMAALLSRPGISYATVRILRGSRERPHPTAPAPRRKRARHRRRKPALVRGRGLAAARAVRHAAPRPSRSFTGLPHRRGDDPARGHPSGPYAPRTLAPGTRLDSATPKSYSVAPVRQGLQTLTQQPNGFRGRGLRWLRR